MAKDKTEYKGRVARPPASAGFWQKFWWEFTHWAVKHKFWQRLGYGLLALILLVVGGLYGISRWYENKLKNQPTVIGTSFIANYAEYFGLDPQETLAAIIDDLGIKHLRLVSYWSYIERERGQYDFEELDWQFRMAEEKGAKVSLAVGLRQPRWPECHMPTWAEEIRGDSWHQPLYDFMGAVVDRYKNSPALESYQLENEFFLSIFAECADASKDRLIKEFDLVKARDPNHPIIMSVSGDFGIPFGDDPAPDIYAMALYKRVYEPNFLGRYVEYPYPDWLYSGRAGIMHILHKKPVFVHEMQAEPWTPSGDIPSTPLQEQDKSMNTEMLAGRFKYFKSSGLKRADLWGAEWWYWRLTKRDDPSMWQAVKSELQKVTDENSKLPLPKN